MTDLKINISKNPKINEVNKKLIQLLKAGIFNPKQYRDLSQQLLAVSHADPKLANSAPEAIFGVVMFCHQNDLNFLSTHHEIYITSFRGKPVPSPSYKVLVQTLYAGGEVKLIYPRMVHKTDLFTKRMVNGVDEVVFEMDVNSKRNDYTNYLGVYWQIILKKDKTQLHEFITKAQVDDVRSVAKSQAIWTGKFADRMIKKGAFTCLAPVFLPGATGKFTRLLKMDGLASVGKLKQDPDTGYWIEDESSPAREDKSSKAKAMAKDFDKDIGNLNDDEIDNILRKDKK